jgi:hypothetical protein
VRQTSSAALFLFWRPPKGLTNRAACLLNGSVEGIPSAPTSSCIPRPSKRSTGTEKPQRARKAFGASQVRITQSSELFPDAYRSRGVQTLVREL